jgi:hypothetical protein
MAERHDDLMPEEGATEGVLAENLSRLLAAAERPPILPAERAAEVLRALQAKQRELMVGDPSPAGLPRKEREMQCPISQATFPSNGQFTSTLVVRQHRGLSYRPSRRHWRSLVAAAVVLIAFVAWALRAGRPSKDVVESPAITPSVTATAAAKGEADRVTRHKLDDGTIVVARPGTKFAAPRPRELSLERGEIYLIVAKNGKPFVVTTPQGEAKATGTRFHVTANNKVGETRAAVAQGAVTLSGRGGSVALRAGQQGILTSDRAPTRQPAPRLSYLVSWAKEALSQEDLLVKKPEAESGLIAVDPWGQEVRLTLRKYHVDVYIEDGIARTTIDQTFFNHNPWNTEGTFYFPLPPDASVSRLAMYVSGKLNEGGMVPRMRGQQIYDEIRYQNRDPALLEMMEGNVFKMRIFPLEGRQEKRIFLSYTQKLPELYGTLRYWFPMDHTHHVAKALSIRVHVKDGAGRYEATSSTHNLRIEPQEGKDKGKDTGKDLVLTYAADNARPDQDFLLHLLPVGEVQRTQFATFASDGFNYVFCRLTPDIAAASGKAESLSHRPRQWIILNDVSASRSKIDVAAQRYIVRRLLAEADDGDSLAVIDVNTAAHVVTRLLPIQQFRDGGTSGTRGPRVEPLSPNHAQYPWPERELLGATNLQAAFEAAGTMIREERAENPHILCLGDGVATDGQNDLQPLLKAMPAGATFVGIGVGKKVESRLLQAAADTTGGMFATINPDEDIDWRVFDLLAALNTPRLAGVEVAMQGADGKPVEAIAYPSARALSAGETLFVVGRTAKELPATVVLRGTVASGKTGGGKKFEQSYSLAGAKSGAAYIPRFWAKQHIDELLKAGEAHKAEIERLSMQYYVVTPYTSLIVLENDKMYEEFKVERGRKDHWALYPAPPEIPVVREEIDWGRYGWWGWGGGGGGEDTKVQAKTKPQSVQDIVESVQFRINAPFYYTRPQRDDSAGRLALYRLVDGKGNPTGLLTYLYLLASGQASPTAKPAGQSGPEQGDDQGEPSGGAPGRGFAARGGQRPLLLMIDEEMIPQVMKEKTLEWFKLADPLPQWELAYRLPGVRSARGHQLLMDMGFFEQDEKKALKQLLLPALTVSDTRRAFEPQGWGIEDFSKKRLVPSLLGVDGGFLYHDEAVAAQLPAELLNSYRQALATRWGRINRDIRQFNRQYGYWEWDWDGDMGGLDLGESVSADWYSGLEELLGAAENKEKKARIGLGMSVTWGDFEGEGVTPFVTSVIPVPPAEFSLLDEGRKRPPPLALAWVSYFGQTMRSLPGTCTVLAADHLAPRRDELKKLLAKAKLTTKESTEHKQELAAIERALAGVEAAAARLESSAPFWSHQGWDYRPRPATIEPPTVQTYQGYNWSFDLTSYAPGLYSTAADILSEVVAQYGLPPATGKVSPEARRRIEAARAAIRPVRIRYGKEGPAVLAASGDRFAVTRQTEMYLTERMVCDGREILHLYGELGLAARRPASPLRLASLRQLAPHFLPPADWLARNFNVELGDFGEAGLTLHLTPNIEQAAGLREKQDVRPTAKQPEYRLTIHVRHDGLITQKSLYADGKLLAKLVYEYAAEPAGQITARWLDKDDKELAKLEFTAQPLEGDAKAVAGNFEANLADYVVFDMPLRKPSYYAEKVKELGERDAAKRIELLRHQALASIQELNWRRWGGANDEVQKLLAEAAKLIQQAGGKRKLGDIALAGSAAIAIAPADRGESSKEFSALHRYFHERYISAAEAEKLAKEYPQTLVGHMAAYHTAAHHGDPAKLDRFIKDYGDSPLLLAAAYHCAHYGNKPEAFFLLYDHPNWRGLAILMSAGQLKTPAHVKRLDAAVAAWHRDMTAAGYETPISPQLAAQLAGQSGWEAVVQDQFARAKKAEGVAALLRFAENAAAWGKAALADEALSLARERVANNNSLEMKLALGQAHWACNKFGKALALYNQVLAGLREKQIPASPALLAATARLAAAAGDQARAIELEEQALAIEHQRLPELVNLYAYRQRYQWLWERLSAKVQETAGKDAQAASEWLGRAERVWRQWHEVDRDNPHMIHQMATAQMAAGRHEAAWLYLSTLIDQQPKDAASYASVAQWHAGRNDLDQAQQFYAKAYPWDEANPQWLIERAQLLDRLGRKAEARQLYRQVLDGKWPPGRQGYVEQAKKALQ